MSTEKGNFLHTFPSCANKLEQIRIFLAASIDLHGAIHFFFFGFLKGFELAAFKGISKPIFKTYGTILSFLLALLLY